MKDLDLQALAADLDRPTATAVGLPARVYFDPAVFDAECERLFPRTWMAVAAASDIPDPGDATIATVARRNVVLLRDREGVVRAFYNACRHRGMKLVHAPTKGLRSIVCPFHAWTYTLDGQLRNTPYLGGIGVHELEGFDRDTLGLIPVRVGEWCNTLFVNLDGNAPPLDVHLAPLIRYLGGDRDWNALHHYVPGVIRDDDVVGNWKEYVEVSLEEYHLKFAHPQVFEGFDPLTWTHAPVDDGFLIGSQSQLAGSFGTAQASDVPLPRWLDRGPRWESYVSLFPNLGIFATSDQLSVDWILPLDVGRYGYRQECYLAPDVAIATTHRPAAERLVATWRHLMGQDGALFDGLHQNQHTNDAIGNRARFAGQWEVGVHRFHQHWVRALAT